jgi:hypothetical protein
MISSMVSKRTKEINPERYITSELKKKASADKTDTTLKDLIGLLLGTLLC